ncbi:MAG: hypothetical protein Q8L64_05130 [bacterium]|nr:hypothetical protein [bacterium]
MKELIPSPIQNDLYRLVILHDSFGRILHQHTIRLPAPEIDISETSKPEDGA